MPTTAPDTTPSLDPAEVPAQLAATTPPARRSLGEDFARRMVTVMIGGPIAIAITYAGGPVYDILVAGIGLIAATEMNNLVRPGRAGLILLVALIAACMISIISGQWILLVGSIVIAVLLGALEVTHRPGARAAFFWRTWAFMIMAALYIGVPMALAILLRGLDGGNDGRWWTGVLFAANWGTDGFALIGGRLFGRTKLAPAISPGKTVEGTVIGISSGITIALVLGILVFGLPAGRVLPAALVVALLTVLGDLLESWLKRKYQVKDSSSLLPGHGGVLDRIDGALLAIPGLYLLLLLMGVR